MAIMDRDAPGQAALSARPALFLGIACGAWVGGTLDEAARGQSAGFHAEIARRGSGGFWSCRLCRPELAPIALDKRFGIGPHVTEPHFLPHLFARDRAAVERVGEQRVEIGFLVAVGVARVIGRDLANDRQRKIEKPALLEGEIDRQARLPRLRAPLGVVDQLRVSASDGRNRSTPARAGRSCSSFRA